MDNNQLLELLNVN